MAFRWAIQQSPLYSKRDAQWDGQVKDTRITVQVNEHTTIQAYDTPKFGCSTWETGVNWPSCGTLPVEETQRFADAMKFAADLIDGVRQQREAIIAWYERHSVMPATTEGAAQ